MTPWRAPHPVKRMAVMTDEPAVTARIPKPEPRGSDLLTMTNEEVRAHCLDTARAWLAKYEEEGRASGDLARAVQYATLAEAFRP